MQSDALMAAAKVQLSSISSFIPQGQTDRLYAVLEFHVGKYNVQFRGPMPFRYMTWDGAYVYSYVKPGGWVQIVFRYRKGFGGEIVKVLAIPEWPYTFSFDGRTYRTHFTDLSSTNASIIALIQQRVIRDVSLTYDRLKLSRDRKDHPVRYLNGGVTNPQRASPETDILYYPIGSETYNSAYTNTLASYTYNRRVWTGTRTPNFRNLKGKQLPINVHSVNMVKVYTDNAFVDYVRTGSNGPGYWGKSWNRYAAYPVAGWDPGEPTHGDSTVWNRAVQKTIDRAQVALQANLAQDLAQFGQTTRLVVNTASRIIGSIKSLRKGDFPGAVGYLVDGTNFRRRRRTGSLSVSRSLAENWLELQYGWKPLLQDVEGSMRSTAQFIARDRTVSQVRSSANDTKLVVRSVTSQSGPVFGHSYELLKRQVRLGFRFKIDDHLKTYLSQTGFTNPLNLGWEILPFSFVVDWFLPVGPYLEALSAWKGLVFVDGFQTQFTSQRLIAVMNIVYKTSIGSPNEVEYRPYGAYSRDWIKLNRAKLTAFPNKRLPNLKNPVSVTHALNLLALLRVMFRTPFH